MDASITSLYDSYAPGAPDVFIDDAKFRELWAQPDVKYLVVRASAVPRLQGLVGSENLHTVTASGGKVLLANHLIGDGKAQP